MMCNFNSGYNPLIYYLVCFSLNVWITNGQRYRLTGSSEFAVLGETFTWTCDMFVPPGYFSNAVKFFRNNKLCVVIINTNTTCATQSENCGYSYECLSDSMFSLSISAENMTEYENGSKWRCDYVVNIAGYASPQVVLNITTDVQNVSLIPTDNPLTLREGNGKEIQCKVHGNAFPAPVITWYLGSTVITSIEGTHETSITVVVNRTDNRKTLHCRASNISKEPVIASTTLNVEYPPSVNAMSQQDIIEGRNLLVTCQATPGNPSSIKLYWTKVDNQGFRQNGTTIQLPNIQRTSSGTYKCTAENMYSNGEKGSHGDLLDVNVQYPPTVNSLHQQNILEGRDLSITCQATPGNPSSTTVFWTNEDNSGFKQNGATLQLPNIQRTSSGTYRCTAENNYSNGEKGTHSQTMEVNVQYPPTVNALSQQDLIEGGNLSVACQATPGNPSSTTFYWTKDDNQEFRQNGSILQLYTIQRNSSGTIKCTAENRYNDEERGIHSQSLVVNVQYPPVVNVLSNQNIIEGSDLSVNCTANPGNPNSTTFYWTKVNNKGFRQSGSTLQLLNIQRTSSGTYRCTAENIFKSGEKGTHSQSFFAIVQYTSYPAVAAVVGSVGGTIALIVIITISVILVYRRYHSYSEQQKQNKNKNVTTKEDESNYTTLQGYESRERNVYDEMTKSEATNHYANIPSMENKEINTISYENLERSFDAKDTEYYNLQNMEVEQVLNTSSEEPDVRDYQNTSFKK